MASIGKASSSAAKFPETRKVSLLLVFFRWIAFLIAFLFIYPELAQPSSNNLISHLIISITFLYSIFLSYFYGKGLQNSSPFTKLLIVVDTIYCGFLLWITTGSLSSPYFLYALTPILTAAFFFKMIGGFAAATVVSCFYLAGLAFNQGALAALVESGRLPNLTVNILAFFLAAIFFAYPASLLDKLLSTVDHLIEKNDTLTAINRAFERANRQLRTLQKTSTAMHSTMNLNEILDIVLAEITKEIGFEGAMLGLCDEENKTISNWIVSNGYKRDFLKELKELEIPISKEGGLVAKSILERKPYLVGPKASLGMVLPSYLKDNPFAVLPMTSKGRTIGVLLVDNHKSKRLISEEDIPVLRSIANQAAVAIENAKLMIKNQMLIVAEERNRIAREIHDGLAQSLFSIALNLQACVKKMEDDPLSTRGKLTQLQELASKSLRELRQYIYNLPTTCLVDMGLVTALRAYANDVARLNGLKVDFSVVGKVRDLPPEVEECFYKVGQEALANVVKHAEASRVGVKLEFKNKKASISITDNGRGLGNYKPKQSMGINNMRQRVESLGGTFLLDSDNGRGVCVRAEVCV